MFKRLLACGVALATLAAVPLPAAAQDSIYVPLFTYRTGPFSGGGTYIANGMRDYLTMLNERDGGIGGVKLLVDECETGYDTKKGLECYEAVKPKNPVMMNPWSTGATLPLIPKAAVDKIPILSMAYGLSASADGNRFPWVFNPPNTYWDGLATILKYVGDQEGGMEKLKGKKIGYLYLDAGFGKEPIPLFEQLAKDYGFELKMYPVAATEMQNQSSQWLAVRRDRPDYMVMYGWGAMHRPGAEGHGQEGRHGRGRPPRAREHGPLGGALEGDRPRRLRRAAEAQLRGPQRPQGGLHPGMGRHQVGEDHGADRAAGRQGAADPGGRRQGLRREELGLAEADRGLRQELLTERSPANRPGSTIPADGRASGVPAFGRDALMGGGACRRPGRES
jgi:hypothetical protein